VQAIDRVDRKALEQAISDKRQRAGADFFGGLKDEMEGAAKAARVREPARGREQDRGMAVVPASMHDPNVRARVRKAGGLVDRQRVEIGADRQSLWAVAASERSDDAGLANSRRDLIAPSGEQPGDDA
jgi:hypothetical protein